MPHYIVTARLELDADDTLEAHLRVEAALEALGEPGLVAVDDVTRFRRRARPGRLDAAGGGEDQRHAPRQQPDADRDLPDPTGEDQQDPAGPPASTEATPAEARLRAAYQTAMRQTGGMSSDGIAAVNDHVDGLLYADCPNGRTFQRDDDGYITGEVHVDLDAFTDPDLEDVVDLLSEALTGSPLLMDVAWNVVGHQGDTLRLLVHGDPSEVIAHFDPDE